MKTKQVRFGVDVECIACHRTKKPRGRSAPMESAGSYCDDDCAGYFQPPLVGDLWPGESAEDFGYPSSVNGTEEREIPKAPHAD